MIIVLKKIENHNTKFSSAVRKIILNFLVVFKAIIEEVVLIIANTSNVKQAKDNFDTYGNNYVWFQDSKKVEVVGWVGNHAIF